ncbi:CAP domain-containing protein [Streptomyces sp. NK08204]|uniref:CAP domain-containing protein n=1 Tax=Streptomyces sp. NK08204 TaxID=2873260 RepID=UPI001CECC474|nr:CAP domain-containing protein [Streptomyces sp. NK08204]
MGRHRRSAAGRPAKGRAAGVTRTQVPGTGSDVPQDSYAGEHRPVGITPYLNTGAYAEANARSAAYLYATAEDPVPDAPGAGGPARAHASFRAQWRRKRGAKPVRMRLLGASVALAFGAIAVTTGVVPGLESFRLGGATSAVGGDRVRAEASVGNRATAQGGTSGDAGSRRGGTTGRAGTHRSTSAPAPSASASASASTAAAASASTSASTSVATSVSTATSASASVSASASPSPTPSKPAPRKPTPKAPNAPKKPTATAPSPARPVRPPSRPATTAPAQTSVPVTVSPRAAVEAQVLKLVNDERAKAGCSPLAANSSLTGLAETFSDDMAARNFFGHTGPDGLTPWDRAAKAGITGLGGENIARGQADPAAVMAAWMNSPGDRANILNCGFKTLGVGVHLGPGGPWWTQDFGS